MMIKIFGAVLVIVGCGGFGFCLSLIYRNTTKLLRQLISALEYMECELTYRLTPLPELCRLTATICSGRLGRCFYLLAQELDNQISPDVSRCMYAALEKVKDVPKEVKELMILLGNALGNFDLEGQLKGLEAVRLQGDRVLDMMSSNQDIRLRNYQTLGLCAGAAVVILFI